MKKKERKNNNLIYQPFDTAFKVIIDFCPELAFKYLNLPGKYYRKEDREFQGTDGTRYQLDSLFQSILENEENSGKLIINIEHQPVKYLWISLKKSTCILCMPPIFLLVLLFPLF